MKNDRLSNALHRGDLAENYSEAQTADERKTALLARCAADPSANAARAPFVSQQSRPRKMRWAVPALAGAGTLTVAALYGAAAWFGANTSAHQNVPAQMAKISPRPSATVAPRKNGSVPLPRPVVPESGIAQTPNTKKSKTRRDTSVAAPTLAVRATKLPVSAKPLRQNETVSPVPVKAIVRANRKKNGPLLAAVAPKAQATPAPREIVEPVVERVIIEQDATPAETAPPVTTVAITMNGRSESVIVSRAAEPIAN